MDLLPSEEQTSIIDTTRHFLSRELPVDTIRQRRDEPLATDPATWRACADVGLFGLGLPESDGGAGFALAEEVLVFREFGRFVASGPVLSTVLAGHLAAAAGDHELTGAIVTGTSPVGLAVARPEAGGFDLFDTAGTSLTLIVGPHGQSLVETEALGDPTPLTCIDPGVRLAQAPAGDPTARLHDAAPAGWHRALVLAAAYLVGTGEAARDDSVQYAKTREQFGRPIGVFQAVKHMCADMAVRSEASWAQVLFAAISVQAGRPDAAFQAYTAHLVAARNSVANAQHAIQVFGGMGYTYECDAHLLLKRAEVFRHQLGQPAAKLAALLALPSAQAA